MTFLPDINSKSLVAVKYPTKKTKREEKEDSCSNVPPLHWVMGYRGTGGYNTVVIGTSSGKMGLSSHPAPLLLLFRAVLYCRNTLH
jgi:hypothetical protein